MHTRAFKSLAMLSAGLMMSATASAGLITVSYEGNDCSGVFGQGFENCEVNGSAIIAKYDAETAEDDEFNTSEYPSIDGSEFSSNSGSSARFTASSGNWYYTPGANDPGVRYWVAKGGPGFNLFYVVPDESDGLCAGSGATSCLNLAISQTSGRYAAPTGKGLSHLSFYNGASASVPEPGSLALLGAGLLGLGVMRRKRQA